jgi:hypothetical protein
MRIRQIALVARELDRTVARLCETLDAEVCFSDPGVSEFGLHNALIAFGDTFLEVVSPTRADTTAGRLLDRRGGDGGYMVILQSDDLAADRARVDSLKARVVWQIALKDIASFHLHPKDIGGAIVSLDQPVPPASWRWAGPEWQHKRRSRVASQIIGAELQAEQPQAMAARWAEVLDRPCKRSGEDSYAIDLEPGAVRFTKPRDGRGEGLAGFDLQAAPGQAPRELSLCGTRIRLL